MAAISCYTIPPLFFLNNYYLIAYVIKTVYEKANEICMRYEKDAFEFLKNNEFRHNSLMGLYARPSKKKGCEATFRQLVKKQHLHHLDLYRQYLEQCYKAIGLSEKDKIRLVDVINKYRDNYTRWGGEKECF
jgi:Iap family predicted aminopeptidase